MTILHYSLGFPPYRTGGLTKFCTDLMKEQVNSGYRVALLWPGEIRWNIKNVEIRGHKPINGIGNYELVNPLPIPYDEGIKDFKLYIQSENGNAFENLLEEIKPDVIHIHSLMGLYREFVESARRKNIKLVYTTHDYFPICPKVTMFRNGKLCSSFESCEDCGICNTTALNLSAIRVLQSPPYRMLKDCKIVEYYRKRHRTVFLNKYISENTIPVGTKDDFFKLRAFYCSILQQMDIIHFNSSLTKSIYEKVIKLPKSRIISITHADIKDCRRIKQFNYGSLRIRYLGQPSGAKGYYLLRDALDELWRRKKDFQLDVHFTPLEVTPYMQCHGKYKTQELEKVFDDTDVLICPSIWNETFGYTVLEALSFGVPVVISDTVGAKDILNEACGLVFKSNDKKALIEALEKLNPQKLSEMNSAICQYQGIKTMRDMSDEILSTCYK